MKFSIILYLYCCIFCLGTFIIIVIENRYDFNFFAVCLGNLCLSPAYSRICGPLSVADLGKVYSYRVPKVFLAWYGERVSFWRCMPVKTRPPLSFISAR